MGLSQVWLMIDLPEGENQQLLVLGQIVATHVEFLHHLGGCVGIKWKPLRYGVEIKEVKIKTVRAKYPGTRK